MEQERPARTKYFAVDFSEVDNKYYNEKIS